MPSNYDMIRQALKTFGLPVLTSAKDVKQKYRELAKRYHPDVYEEKEKMVEINLAYEVLTHYMEEYRFTFSKDEILKQYPEEQHGTQFSF